MICGSGGSKSRLAKAAGAEPAGQVRDEKLHAIVARSTFPSQIVQNTPFSDHFWKLRCQKSARRCGAKHISKWKCTKHTILGPLLEVEMSKKCTPLWREAHFEENAKNTRGSDHFWTLRCRKSARRCGAKHIFKSKCTKHTMVGPLLEVEMSKKCTPLWREARFQVKMYKTPHVRATFGGSDVASLRFTTLHYITLHYTPLHYKYNCNYTTTLHYTPLHYTTLNYTTLRYITLHYTPLQIQLQLHNYTPLHSTTLHYTKLHYTTLHYITLHYTILHYTTRNYTTLHSTTLHYTTLHYLPLHFTTLHYTTLHYNYNYTTTLHYTPLHYNALHYITLHYTTFHYTSLHYTALHSTPLQIQLS